KLKKDGSLDTAWSNEFSALSNTVTIAGLGVASDDSVISIFTMDQATVRFELRTYESSGELSYAQDRGEILNDAGYSTVLPFEDKRVLLGGVQYTQEG